MWKGNKWTHQTQRKRGLSLPGLCEYTMIVRMIDRDEVTQTRHIREENFDPERMEVVDSD